VSVPPPETVSPPENVCAALPTVYEPGTLVRVR